MGSRGPKEIAYDELIAPLMAQIIATCKAHKINAFATFSLDLDEDGSPMACTTSLPVDTADVVGLRRADRCWSIVYGPRPAAPGFRITTEHADGSKSVEVVAFVK